MWNVCSHLHGATPTSSSCSGDFAGDGEMSKPPTRVECETWIRVHGDSPGLIPAGEYAELMRHHLRALAVVEYVERGIVDEDSILDLGRLVERYRKGV